MSDTSLVRGLRFRDALSLVVGSMIGTGVFLKAAIMAQWTGSPVLVLAAWGVAGALSLAGAFAYAEVGSRFPRAGGEYVYLREAYGPLVGFLYGWTRFWIGSPGSVAAYGVGIATFSTGILPLSSMEKPLVAVGVILSFGALNCFAVAFGGRVQTCLTFLKVVLILGLTAAIFLFSSHAGGWAGAESVRTSASQFGLALVAALWAYDGWNNLPMASGEVMDPQRNVPRALVAGTVIVFATYALLNFAFFHALPFAEVLTASSTRYPTALPVATKAAQSFLGASGQAILSGMFILSAIGAMNGSILTGARVPYAMAKDGLFFAKLAEVHPVSRVPVVAVVAQTLIACALAVSGTFDQLTDWVVFTSWIFYALVTLSVYSLRKRTDIPPAAYHTWGYPWLPAVFCVASVLLLGNTLWNSPRETCLGLAFVLLGVPVYRLFTAKK